MSRQWVRKETNIGDIKKLREAVERMSPNSEIIFDEYLTDQHSNEYCNVNKFYYGAIVENANETYQAYTGYGRIGINTGVNTSRVGGLKLQKEGGASSNYQTAKYYLDQKLDKKKKGKRCRKCGNWASYTAKTPEKMAESMNTQEFAKLMGAYPLPPDNQYAVGGFMDEGFEWTVNQAETFNASSIFDDHHNLYRLEIKRNTNRGWELLRVWKNEQDAINNYYDIYLDYPEVRLLEVVEDGDSENIMSQRNAYLQKEEFGSSNIVSRVKNNWLNGLIGLGVALVGYDFLKKKVLKSDTIIENPNTGSLKPADYEELVVQSTGYYVPIIPVGLDPAFMGSRFHALPTDRYVYDDPQGIGAHIDVAMNQNTNFLPNEQSLVTKQSEAPGQSPYNSMQPNGQENPDFAYRAIHETTTVSLDGSVAKYIPQDLSGYTGQQFIPTSVYEDMLGIGISGQTPSFTVPASSGLGSNRFGSRMANPDTLTNVVGVLNENVNGDYTDGSNTMSLSQWTMNNQVQQISDTEAIVIERGSGSRKMIRRV
jgi:hypothetical protein